MSSRRPVALALAALLLASPVAALAQTKPPAPTPPAFEKIGGVSLGGFEQGAAEIVSYDPASKKLFVVNAGANAVEVLDISDPASPKKLDPIAMAAHGAGINSVAVKNGLLAVAVEADPKQQPGSVAVFDTTGKHLKSFPVGALPDNVVFSPDGSLILAACEGEPNKDYSQDPEGAVAIISLKQGVDKATVAIAGFEAFNPKKKELQAKGVRISHPKATVAQDLEPEYIAVAPDGKTAYVTLQENNALAVVDLAAGKVKDILPLGLKDWKAAGKKFDASDKDKKINLAPWPVLGMYMPDTIAAYAAGGKTWLVMANEGDSREYGDYSDETRGAKLLINDRVFPDAGWLKRDKQLGRLKMVKDQCDLDGDGLAERLVAFGARSFTIRDAATGAVVFDSGDDFESLLAKEIPDHFNADADDPKADARSDDKGPEPEGLAIGEINGRLYAFVGLERQGGLMIYDITQPKAATFVQHVNSRDYKGDAKAGTAGDLAPEGVLFIAAKDSPTGKPLVVTANEVSGTVAVFSVK